MDSEFQVITDHGLPTPKKKPREEYQKYPWRAMKTGDFFIVPNRNIFQMCALARKASQRFAAKYSCETTSAGVRVWRVE